MRWSGTLPASFGEGPSAMKINLPGVNCPECEQSVNVTMEDVAKERVVRCPRGHEIQLRDEGHGARNADRSLKKVEQTIKNFGK